MGRRRRAAVMLAMAALGIAALGLSPARAAGATTCEIVATVTLDTVENLANVNGGKGTLSANFVCEGTVAGAALNSPGNFAFCLHTATSHSPQCKNATGQNPADQPSFEPIGDALGSPDSPIIAHVVGNISLTLNSGTSCSMSLNGHTLLVQADLDLVGMACSNGFVADTAHADATAEIIVNPLLDCTAGPGGSKLCFDTLTFVGQLVAIDS